MERKTAATIISLLGWISLLALVWLKLFYEVVQFDYVMAMIVSFLFGFFGAVSGGAERRR